MGKKTGGKQQEGHLGGFDGCVKRDDDDSGGTMGNFRIICKQPRTAKPSESFSLAQHRDKKEIGIAKRRLVLANSRVLSSPCQAAMFFEDKRSASPFCAFC